jgi:REP element-mobilizing transposase RayT
MARPRRKLAAVPAEPAHPLPAHEFATAGHAVYRLQYRILFRTTCARCLTAEMHGWLRTVFHAIAKKSGAGLYDFAGGPNYVVLTVLAKPNTAIGALVAALKSASSRRIKKEFAESLGPALAAGEAEPFWELRYLVMSTGEWQDAEALLAVLDTLAEPDEGSARG